MSCFWVGGATEWGGEPAPGLQMLTLPKADASAHGPNLTLALALNNNPMFAANVRGLPLVVSHEVGSGHLTTAKIVEDEGVGCPSLDERTALTAPTGSADPTHIAIAIGPSGERLVLAANYSGGALSVNPITQTGIAEPSLVVQYSGRGPNEERQTAPHPHQVVVDQRLGFALVPDLGTDNIHVHKLEDLAAGNGQHWGIPMPSGSGPRHLVVAQKTTDLGSEPVAIVACELDSTVRAVSLVTGSMLAETPATGHTDIQNMPSAIRITAGNRVLVGNRGPDTIAVFDWDQDEGALKFRSEHTCGGRHPRDFELNEAETKLIVANLQSNNLAIFDYDDAEGALVLTQTIPTASPSCVVKVA